MRIGFHDPFILGEKETKANVLDLKQLSNRFKTNKLFINKMV